VNRAAEGVACRSGRLPGDEVVVRGVAGFLLLSLLMVLLPATESPAQEGSFEDVSQVLEVQIPVNVFFRDGEPVRGLTVDDFEVFEDGQLREIVDFEVVDLEVLGPDVRPQQADSVIPRAARRHVLLLFDLSFSDASSVLRARSAAREFVLTSLHPTDLVAVATHSVDVGSQLVITFTPDRAQVARAIDTLGAPRLLHLVKRDPLSFIIDDPLAVSGTTGNDSEGAEQIEIERGVADHLRVVSNMMNRMEKSYARGRIFTWASTMGQLARFLDTVQGRKQVVYFSEGFDGRLLLGRPADANDAEAQADRVNIELGQHWLVDTDDLYGNTPLQNDVRGMIDEFQRADAVIQAVDISGLRADRPDETRGARAGEDALFWVANETGGALYRDANDLGRELEEALSSSSVTYLLTFTAADIEFDGSYHRVRVKADVPRGSRISYRKGYYAPRPFQDLHPLEKSLLASGAIASADLKSDLEIDVLTAPFRASEGKAYVPVIIEVDGDSLMAGHEEDVLSVEFYGYVTNERGEMRDFFTQMVSLNVNSNRNSFSRKGLKYYGHLDLPDGDYLIRVLVRNAQTGRTGVQTVPLDIPVWAEGEPILLPPFFPEPPASWHLARETETRYQKSVVYPFTVNGEPYVPSARPNLRASDKARVCLVAYNLGEGRLALEGRIVDDSGGIVAERASLRLVERTVTGIEGLDKLLATFEPEGLAAGTYVLEVALRDNQNGPSNFNSIPFTILN
jgi:VWFA-related protein